MVQKVITLSEAMEEVISNTVNDSVITTDKAISLFNYLGDISQFLSEYISNHKSEFDNLNTYDYPLGKIMAAYKISKEDKKNNELKEALNKGVIVPELAHANMTLYILSSFLFPSKRK